MKGQGDSTTPPAAGESDASEATGNGFAPEDDPGFQRPEPPPEETKTTDALRRFRGVSLSDFFASAGREVTWLDPDKRYLPEKGLVIIGGQIKHAKTYIAGWIAVRTAFAGVRVLFVEEEGSDTTLRSRLEPFTHPMPSALDPVLRIIHRGGLNLSDDESVDALLAAQLLGHDAFHPQLVVLDALYVLAGCDMKDQWQMGKVFRNVQRIVVQLSCTVLLLHHVRKKLGGQKRRELTDIDDLLGTVFLGANADLVMLVNKLAKQQPGKLVVHLVCPDNGSRVGEPFVRRLLTFEHLKGIASVTDIEDPPSTKTAKEDRDAPGAVEDEARRVTEVLRPAIAKLAPGMAFSVHQLASEKGHTWRDAVSMAAGILADEGAIIRRGRGYAKPSGGMVS